MWFFRLNEYMNKRLEYIARTKLKVIAGLLGIALAAIATISFAGLPLLPTIGFAVAAAAVSLRKMAARLDHPTCLACGHDLRNEPIGGHGIACPECGSITMPRHPVDQSSDVFADAGSDDAASDADARSERT